MQKPVLAALLALGLVACASPPTPFEPAQGPKQLGYSELKIETNRYRVVYRGTDHPGAPAEDLALLHAADLTLAQGYDWFRVTSRSDTRQQNGPTLSLGGGGTEFGRHSAVGVGVGTSFDLGGAPLRSVTLEVVMEKGAPPHQPDAYDAHDAAKTIRARL
jgi:hypothetical protein